MTDTPDISPNLGLPFYQTKQNEFEVQHNEALLMLDALVMLSVIDRDLSAPPSSPAIGDRYLVKPVGTGDFGSNDNRIAQYDIGGWIFHAPRPGWTCHVQDEATLLVWDGAAWQPALDEFVSELQNLALLGLGAEADATNPWSAKLNNALWAAKTVAEGGDGNLHTKMSKESASNTLSLLLQDNFSGRAEIGLTGDDDLHVKVSADGASWLEAIVVDRATGAVTLPNTPPAASAHGCCRLTKSGADLLLSPCDGNTILIDGAPCTIPDAGVTLSPGGLSANTTYNIYAYLDSGVLTLEASATGHAVQAGTGVEIKSGDPSRTLVGMARTNGSTAWVDSATQRLVRSWFNSPAIELESALAASRSTQSTSYVDINSGELQCGFLVWAGEIPVSSFSAFLSSNQAVNTNAYAAIGFDGTTPEVELFTPGTATFANVNLNCGSVVAKPGLSEGYHYVTGLMKIGNASSTATMQGAQYSRLTTMIPKWN
jgi:hypothetical protein